jgi:hypothetical protein
LIEVEAVALATYAVRHMESRTERPRLMGCTWQRMGAHGDRLPRLTLKAGRKEGHKAGLPVQRNLGCKRIEGHP